MILMRNGGASALKRMPDLLVAAGCSSDTSDFIEHERSEISLIRCN